MRLCDTIAAFNEREQDTKQKTHATGDTVDNPCFLPMQIAFISSAHQP